MFSLFKKQNDGISDIYEEILRLSREPKLYTHYNVPDTPHGRFQMISLHAMPYMFELPPKQSQKLFDTIFQDIEYSFREIGVGDLAVPKKMKRYMKDFNGMIQAHAVANANHVDITKRNVFGDDDLLTSEFKEYIKGVFA